MQGQHADGMPQSFVNVKTESDSCMQSFTRREDAWEVCVQTPSCLPIAGATQKHLLDQVYDMGKLVRKPSLGTMVCC